MPNTYTQIHLHLVFAVKYRQAAIGMDWKHGLYNYITGVVHNQGHKLLAVNGMSDHIHVLIGMRPAQSLSDLMQAIKQGSSKWVNENRFTKSRFAWQEGYGAFSYGKSQLPAVIKYIENQEEHHRTRPFLDEYKRFLDAFGVDYDDRYLFKALE